MGKKSSGAVYDGWIWSLWAVRGGPLGEWAGMESRVVRVGPGWAGAQGLWEIPHSLTRAGRRG